MLSQTTRPHCITAKGVDVTAEALEMAERAAARTQGTGACEMEVSESYGKVLMTARNRKERTR